MNHEIEFVILVSYLESDRIVTYFSRLKKLNLENLSCLEVTQWLTIASPRESLSLYVVGKDSTHHENYKCLSGQGSLQTESG